MGVDVRSGKLALLMLMALPFLLAGCAARTINAWPLVFRSFKNT